MSLFCPLCGKNKSKEALFCDECTKKIKSDYEIDVPEGYQNKNQFASPIIDEESTNIINREQESVFEKNEEQVPAVSNLNDSSEIKTEQKPVYEEFKSKKRGKPILWIFLIALLLVAGFFCYDQFVRKGNLERSGWDAAVKENSVDGYLTYMERFPNGIHYAEADSNMRTLKNSETSSWETMRNSDNTAELRDFIRANPNSNYGSLIKTRLDSLSWIGALKQNTADSYSEYMTMSQSDEFNGDYFAEAQERYDMLFQSYPVNAEELDSIKTTISGFYRALSSLSHQGVITYLAPTVNRFFNSGAAPRDRIIGELMVAGAKSQVSTIKFTPNMEAVQYEKMYNGGFKVNVPLTKTYKNNGKDEEMSGYIVHAELNPAYQIVSIHETKPFNDAP